MAVKTLDEAVIFMLERMAESNDRTDRLIAESNDRTDRLITESNERTDRVMAESQIKTDLAIQRMTERIEVLSEEIGVYTKTVREDLSRVGNKLGYVMEIIIAPGIRHEINSLGYNFEKAMSNMVVVGAPDGKRREIAEIDMFLYDDTEAMAVEIKTTLTVKQVIGHLGQLYTLRRFEEFAEIQNKKLFGAVAGVYIDDDARDYALEHGLYVLKIQEEEKRLTAVKPAQPQVW
jgi:hypothetical protein